MDYQPKGREVAEALGISPGRVSQLRKEGMPVDSIASASAWYRRRVDQGRSFGAKRGARMASSQAEDAAQRKGAGPAEDGHREGVSYEEARRRREVAEATTAELRLAELAGELVRRDAVNRLLFTASRVMRDQMLAIAPRLSASLAPMVDPKAIEMRIADEVRVALRALAQELRSGGYAVDNDAPGADPETDTE